MSCGSNCQICPLPHTRAVYSGALPSLTKRWRTCTVVSTTVKFRRLVLEPDHEYQRQAKSQIYYFTMRSQTAGHPGNHTRVRRRGNPAPDLKQKQDDKYVQSFSRRPQFGRAAHVITHRFGGPISATAEKSSIHKNKGRSAEKKQERQDTRVLRLPRAQTRGKNRRRQSAHTQQPKELHYSRDTHVGTPG